MPRRYRQYFQDPAGCEVPRSTRQRQQGNDNNRNDEHENAEWQECSSNQQFINESSTSSSDESTNVDADCEENNVQLSQRRSNSECSTSMLLDENINNITIDEQETSADSSATLRASELFGFSDSEDENFEDSWIRDLNEEVFENSENEDAPGEEENDAADSSMNSTIDDLRFLIPELEDDVNDYDNRFSRLVECLQKEESNVIIETPLVVSKAEILLSILKFGLPYNLPQSAIADLFKMQNRFLGKKIFPDTRYLIDQFFNTDTNTEYHAVCPNCNNYVKKFDRSERKIKCQFCCTEILLKDPTYTNFFATINFDNEIANLIQENSRHYEHIISNTGQNEQYYADITDGENYKELRNSLPEETKNNFATATFNSDGSPLFESSTFSIWPIQLVINELPYHVRTSKPIVCSIWFGKNKPHMNTFFDSFVSNINRLATAGIRCNINNELRNVKIFAICCCADSVARAPMQGLVQFNGYYGCNWCLHPGFYVATERGGCVKYILTDEEYDNRTEEATLQQMEQSVTSNRPIYGVKNPSVLINLSKFNIISGFVPDSMHCVNLGVADQFLDYWLNSVMEPYSLKNQIDNIDRIMQKIKVPNQVMRLSRSIKDRNWWKAKEWENWTLFYSLPILLNFPEMKLYAEHWAALIEAYYLLLQQRINQEDIIRAHNLLKNFVIHTEVYYTKHAMTYNVHQLLHLSQSVINWGPLWSHSGYCFESGNGQLVKTVKAAKGVVYQICRSVAMKQCESILKEHIAAREYSAVSDFIAYLDKRLAKNTVKLSNARYFGRNRKVKPMWVHELEISNGSRIYYKMVKDGCLYNSSKKIRIRSDNSFALTKNNMYIHIVEFIIDSVTGKEYTIANEVKTQCFNDNFNVIRKITSISDRCLPIATNDIERICVHINVGENSYVIAVPNLKYS